MALIITKWRPDHLTSLRQSARMGRLPQRVGHIVLSPTSGGSDFLVDAHLAKFLRPFEQPALSVGHFLSWSVGVQQMVDCFCSELLCSFSRLSRWGAG